MSLKKLIRPLRIKEVDFVDGLKKKYDKDMEYMETVIRSCDDPIRLLSATWWANDTITRYKDFEVSKAPHIFKKAVEKYMELHRDIIGQAWNQTLPKTMDKVAKNGTEYEGEHV